jgi:transcriptional regulator with XRE-family HTH domain
MMIGANRHQYRLDHAMAGDLSHFRTLAEYIDARISASGTSARDLSREFGFSPSYLANLRNGIGGASPERLVQIARYFGDDEVAVQRLLQPNRTPIQDAPPRLNDLIVQHIARSLPQTPVEREGGRGAEPPAAMLSIGDQQFPIYLPDRADRYTPDQLARLFEELLDHLL